MAKTERFVSYLRVKGRGTMATLLLILSTVLAVTLVATFAADPPAVTAQEGGVAKPNIVYIVADDLDKDLLFSMPNIKRLIADQGVTLENYYIPQSQCCPSRTTALTGRYVHNHQVVGNNAPNGGFEKYRARGLDPGNVAGPIEAAGYDTGLFGKFLNEYGPQTGSSGYVGANWTRWFGVFNQQRYNFLANDDGTQGQFADYSDDVIEQKATEFVNAKINADIPVFAYWASLAPHSEGKDIYPAPPGYENEYAGTPSPSRQAPSYDEGDVSDKPSFVRDNPRLSEAQKNAIDTRYQGRARMLKNVDDQVGNLVNSLEQSGQLSNTYIFVTSDNGWIQGEHRIDDAKLQPYEESSNVGMLVRGPGIPAGQTRSELASAHDLYATFTDIAGTAINQDGRSLLPMLEGSQVGSAWRKSVLIENLSGLDGARPNYYGMVTADGKKYVEYANGEKELYYLKADPYELSNKARSTSSAVLKDLSSRLRKLKACSGATCKTAEDT